MPPWVRAHVFLCMLAYYVEWHMRKALAPLLFDDDDQEAARASRKSVVAPAKRSPRALKKANEKKTEDGFLVQSFQGMLKTLSSIVSNRLKPKDKKIPTFEKTTLPNPLQKRALDLLGMRI